MRCRFQYADFTRAVLTNVSILDSDLHGARLDLVASENIDWTGSSLWGALIPINCAFFSGNTFDQDQVHRLLALLLHAKGGWKGPLMGIVDFKSRMLVDRLVNEEEKDDGGPGVPAEDQSLGRDDGRGLVAEVGGQEMAERDRDGALGGLPLAGPDGP
jgi:hypothetical protein